MSKTATQYSAEIETLLSEANKNVEKALALANETGLVVNYHPDGMGTYYPKLTKDQVLKWVEEGSYPNLSWEDRNRADQILSGEVDNFDEDDDYDHWQTSFC